MIRKIKGEKLKRQCLHVHFTDPAGKNNADTVPLITGQTVLEDYLANLSPAEKNRMKFIVGHSTYMGVHEHFPGRPFRYFTFIRNPVSRMRSLYNYARFNMENGSTDSWLGFYKNAQGIPISFTEWVNKLPEQHNPIIDLLFQFDNANGVPVVNSHYSEQEVARAQSILRKFHFIGITEHKDDYLGLMKLLNMRAEVQYVNVTPKNYILEKELPPATEILRAKMQHDLRLYNECLSGNFDNVGIRDLAENH